jgi:hypothetical protein
VLDDPPVPALSRDIPPSVASFLREIPARENGILLRPAQTTLLVPPLDVRLTERAFAQNNHREIAIKESRRLPFLAHGAKADRMRAGSQRTRERP